MVNGDFILDNNNEILIRNGDIVIEDATQQHIALLLISNQGDFKQHPLTGIGIMKYLNSPLNSVIKAKLYREINIQLEDNGLKDINIEGHLNQMVIK